MAVAGTVSALTVLLTAVSVAGTAVAATTPGHLPYLRAAHAAMAVAMIGMLAAPVSLLQAIVVVVLAAAAAAVSGHVGMAAATPCFVDLIAMLTISVIMAVGSLGTTEAGHSAADGHGSLTVAMTVQVAAAWAAAGVWVRMGGHVLNRSGTREGTHPVAAPPPTVTVPRWRTGLGIPTLLVSTAAMASMVLG